MKTLFSSVLMRNSTIVKELSVPLRADNSRIEAKRAQEIVSRWLMNYDFDGKLNPYLLGHAAQAASSQCDNGAHGGDGRTRLDGARPRHGRRGDGAQHNREAEKGASREPDANAFPVGIGVACAA